MLGETGQIVEQLHQVVAQLRPGTEQAHIRIEPGGFRVVVASAHVHIGAQLLPLPPQHQGHLGVGFKADHAIHHMDAGIFQLAGPLDVVFFVKAGLEFHQGHHLFAIFSGSDQGADYLRILRDPVEGHLDGEHIGIIGRLGDEFLHRGAEQVVGVMHQHIPAFEHVKDAFEFLWFD